MTKPKKIYLFVFPLTILFLGFLFFFHKPADAPTEKADFFLRETVLEEDIETLQTKEKEREFSSEKKESIPERFLIKVPFTSQAPFGVWDEISNDACEEASLVMVKYFLDNKKLDPKTAEKEIQSLVAFQNENYGDFKDTDAEKTARMGRDFYGISSFRVVYDFSLEDLKRHLSRGNPIIIPAAGRKLKNPNFKSPGPLYHMLVIVGYEKGKFITNDPGTRKGERYSYGEKVLYEAIHDFTGSKEDIEKGRKAMIVLDNF